MFRRIYFISIAALTLTISGCSIANNKSTQTATPSPCLVFVSSHPEWPGVPCPPTNLSTVTTTPDIFTASSTSFVPSSPSSIDQNNPATWPRHYFKELGFSIKLPFSAGSVETGFAECIRGNLATISTFIKRVCDDPDRYSYWYSALLHGNNDYIFLGSVSEYYADGGEWGLTKLHDFTYRDSAILVRGILIHPLKIISIHGVSIIIFDPGKDIYGDLGADYQMYAAMFKLPKNRKFKAVALQFYASDLNFERFAKAINTIQFSQ